MGILPERSSIVVRWEVRERKGAGCPGHWVAEGGDLGLVKSGEILMYLMWNIIFDCI